MSVVDQLRSSDRELARTRMIAAAIGVLVVFDVVWVRAPFLLILGLPFLIAAWRYRDRHAVTNAVIALACVLYIAVGVSFAMSNGLHAPEEADDATRAIINPGDFAVVYLGTPLAALLGVRVATRLIRRSARNGLAAA